MSRYNLIRFDWAMKRLLRNKANFVVLEGFLSELLQDNIKKKSCDLYINQTSHKIEIDNEKFDIPDIDSILKLKKKLIDKAIQLI